MYIDQSVYPDCDAPPNLLDTPEDRADYVHRICAAWDFGILPEPETFRLLEQWKDVFDRFPILTSPAYHAMRMWFGWEPLAYPTPMVRPEPPWVHLDRLEGRDTEPCEEMI
jgi:hypothetical protein